MRRGPPPDRASSSRRRIYTRLGSPNTQTVAIEALAPSIADSLAGPTAGINPTAVRALVAQDDRRLGPILLHGLEARGLSVTLVSTATAAIAATRDHAYSVIVLDAVFADGDGFRICAELRTRGVETPILFLTDRDSVEDRVHGLELGADDYLGKPFAIRELAARMRALARRAAVVDPLVLRCGDLRLDRVLHQARRGEVDIALSRREFNLLETLMQQPSVVLSRDELLRRAWGERHVGPANVVDVYVGYLRRKIDRPFGRSSLQTIRGIGYRIAPDG